MKQCERCSRLRAEDEFIGGYCGRCDKVAGDVQAEFSAELI